MARGGVHRRAPAPDAWAILPPDTLCDQTASMAVTSGSQDGLGATRALKPLPFAASFYTIETHHLLYLVINSLSSPGGCGFPGDSLAASSASERAAEVAGSRAAALFDVLGNAASQVTTTPTHRAGARRLPPEGASSLLSAATMFPRRLLLAARGALPILQLLVCRLLPPGSLPSHLFLLAAPASPLPPSELLPVSPGASDPDPASGAKGQVFRLRLEPPGPVFPAGQSILANCSIECPNPERVMLETSLPKESSGTGRSWAAYRLSNVTADSLLICSGYCNGSQMSSSSSITVYRFPERVELAPLPSWQPVGENVTLRCQVTGGAPRDRLTAVLLHGEEELSRQLLVGDPTEVTTTVPVGREDHGTNFSCHTELDLRPQGLELFQNTSVPRQLRTFALPATPPCLVTPASLEVGTSETVECTLDGVFPASEALVQLTLGDQMLNSVVTCNGDTLRATATATAHADLEGVQKATCKVSLGAETSSTRNLTVFRPILKLSEANVTEGTTVEITCTAGHRVQVALDGAPSPSPGNAAQLRLTATESDDQRDFSCNASLEVAGELLRRDATARLRVLYGPKIDPANCPQHLAWQDGTTHVLQCQARGNPAPRLQCLQEGSGRVVPIGIPFLVTSHHKGTYRCQAVSARGNDTVLVVMDIDGGRSSVAIVALAAFAALGVVSVSAALLYVHRMQRRSAVYRLVPPHASTSMPLAERPPSRGGGG
ncbi:intercellular adhesion molecule 3 [Ctenodactylus gundi]